MATLDVLNAKAAKVGTMELSDEIFAPGGNSHVVWEVVRQHLAARRAGTHATKTRSLVRGGGRKPWRQKGTGRARVGSTRNPLWRHGGVAHGPQPRSYGYAMPAKKRRVAARRVIAAMLEGQQITVLDELNVAPKTKAMTALFAGLGLPEKALVLVPEAEESLLRAAGNLAGVKVVEPEAVNAYELLKYRRLITTKSALTRLEELLRP